MDPRLIAVVGLCCIIEAAIVALAYYSGRADEKAKLIRLYGLPPQQEHDPDRVATLTACASCLRPVGNCSCPKRWDGRDG